MASFEEDLAALEAAIDQLERGGLPLDESVQLFEDGVRLSRACKARLADAQKRIDVLLEPEGKVRVEELMVDVDEEDDEDDSADDDSFSRE